MYKNRPHKRKQAWYQVPYCYLFPMNSHNFFFQPELSPSHSFVQKLIPFVANSQGSSKNNKIWISAQLKKVTDESCSFTLCIWKDLCLEKVKTKIHITTCPDAPHEQFWKGHTDFCEVPPRIHGNSEKQLYVSRFSVECECKTCGYTSCDKLRWTTLHLTRCSSELELTMSKSKSKAKMKATGLVEFSWSSSSQWLLNF